MNPLDTPRATSKPRTYLPDGDTRADIVDFAKTLRAIESYLTTHASQAALVAPDGSQRSIPDEIFRALEQVANALANGHGVTVAPYSTQMTTQEAADFLGVSRPTLVKLLEQGEIAHEKRGRHRRVMLRDVVEFQEQARSERRDALTDLARAGQGSALRSESMPTLKRLDEE
ncbi:DNA-binding protein [Plantibacter sp. PA-3-X8]|uniref:DNA binding domain-containing protein, excisionase family n=1 Tax=Plantibacter cousiniae (nom. nud.) TaxID=199709 RepID=A0ABY1LGR8_9MICO|nr:MULTISPECIES: helix-turn-helix domain-containing protein [Plantibacter]AZH82301.1 DNA-binding protein [Plantibacter sp. PA-3-X8]MDD9151324.1 helix-turn-helix domain-containing protein [Plantibacter flavus]SKC38914.1 DNA binding domain-containing protein, excisionase family [Plantibacter cousiniae]